MTAKNVKTTPVTEAPAEGAPTINATPAIALPSNFPSIAASVIG